MKRGEEVERRWGGARETEYTEGEREEERKAGKGISL